MLKYKLRAFTSAGLSSRVKSGFPLNKSNPFWGLNFPKNSKNCVLRALLPFGGHLATFHKDAFRFLHRNSFVYMPVIVIFFLFYFHAFLCPPNRGM